MSCQTLVREFRCRSYEDAFALLDGKIRKQVCAHTMLCSYDIGLITLKLHGHSIVHLRSDGSVELNSHGNMTRTVADRMNRCLPWHLEVCNHQGEWVVWTCVGPGFMVFRDGMRIRALENG